MIHPSLRQRGVEAVRSNRIPLTIVAAVCSGIAACVSLPDSHLDSTDGFVNVDGQVRLYYIEKGTGADVLVAPMASYLAPHLLDELSVDRRVIFYDPRNRGRSDAADLATVSLDRQIQDLDALRAHFGFDKMALLGWSGSGMEMAVYTLRHPDRVTRLIQISPVPPTAAISSESGDARSQRVNEEQLTQLDARGDRGEFDDTPAMYCRLRNTLTGPDYFVAPSYVRQIPDLCAFENEWPKNLWSYFAALTSSFGDYDWREAMNELSIPRLIIHGREDRIPLASAEQWAAGYPDARLLVVSPSGHVPYIEQKAAVVDAIRVFLNGDWPPAAVSLPAH